jgi:hypothetical protein
MGAISGTRTRFDCGRRGLRLTRHGPAWELDRMTKSELGLVSVASEAKIPKGKPEPVQQASHCDASLLLNLLGLVP